MPFRAQVCAWSASVGLLAPSLAVGQDRAERDIVELIVRDGPQARAIRAEAEVTRREQLARLAFPNPTFSYSREGAGFTEFLLAEQPLPIGMRAALSRAGVAATAAAEAERDVRLWALRSEAAAAVARLSAEQARLEAARAQVQDVAGLIAILRTREQEGEGSRFDRARAEQELHETRQRESGAAAAVGEARAVLLGMLPADLDVRTVATPVGAEQKAPPLETLLTLGLAARAELRALQQRVARARFEAEAARRLRLPSPTVIGGLKRADEGSERTAGGVLGLSVSMPLFDSGGREAARWNAERARTEAERVAIERRVRAEIAGAFDVLTLRQAGLSQEPAGAAVDLVEMARVAYREGEVGILELLDALRTASRARIRAVELRLDARLAQVALERAVGEALWP